MDNKIQKNPKNLTAASEEQKAKSQLGAYTTTKEVGKLSKPPLWLHVWTPM